MLQDFLYGWNWNKHEPLGLRTLYALSLVFERQCVKHLCDLRKHNLRRLGPLREMWFTGMSIMDMHTRKIIKQARKRKA